MELLLPVLLLAVMYFLLIRPQQQRVKAQRALVAAIEVGDEIVTLGGLIARVTRLDDETVTLEPVPGVSMRFRRGAIAGKVGVTDDDPLARPVDD